MLTIKDRPYFLTPNPRGGANNKPLFVFLPGMDGTGQLLQNQVAELSGEFEIRCLAIPPDLLMSWEDLTAQVVKLIETERLARSPECVVYVCGESFGGCLALNVATHAPELCDRLILVNPAISCHRQPWLGWGEQIVQWLPDRVYKLSAIGLLPFLAALERFASIDRLRLLDAMNSVPKATSIWRLSMLIAFKLEGLALDRLQQPVLAIASGADRLLPSVADARYLLGKIPQGKLVVLPDSGHACLLEQDVNLYQIMKSQQFLESTLI